MAAVLNAVARRGGSTLRLDDPVQRFVPKLADRRVPRQLEGPLEDTMPAERPVTIEDLLALLNETQQTAVFKLRHNRKRGGGSVSIE